MAFDADHAKTISDAEKLTKWGNEVTKIVNDLQSRVILLERRLALYEQEHVDKLLKEVK